MFTVLRSPPLSFSLSHPSDQVLYVVEVSSSEQKTEMWGEYIKTDANFKTSQVLATPSTLLMKRFANVPKAKGKKHGFKDYCTYAEKVLALVNSNYIRLHRN